MATAEQNHIKRSQRQGGALLKLRTQVARTKQRYFCGHSIFSSDEFTTARQDHSAIAWTISNDPPPDVRRHNRGATDVRDHRGTRWLEYRRGSDQGRQADIKVFGREQVVFVYPFGAIAEN